jgi:CubicO group peptidase (beta-lactamase class C family)
MKRSASSRSLSPFRPAAALILALLAGPVSCAPAAAGPVAVAGAPVPASGTAGLVVDQGRLSRIDSVFSGLVRRGEMAGAVLLVQRDGETVYERAFGHADREADREMTPASIFRIASQTKAITSAAILMLAEEGRLTLHDPVSRFIPGFGGTTVAETVNGERRIVPARRQITIRDLLTHTAGISYGTSPAIAADYEAVGLGPAAGFGWYTADRNEPICATMERLAGLPFVAQPGERYVYGYSTDVLGCVVERASGMPLDEFFARRITDPLGMRDTHFFLPAASADRLTAVYTRAPSGELVRASEGARGQGHYVDGPRRSFAGGAGLVSTASDYARFLNMLLNGGELDGVRLLAPRTVELMTTNQVGTRFSTEGEGYSLAFRTLDEPGARARVESVGTYDWGGAYGSSYLVDPVERLVVVFLVQELPNTARHSDRVPVLVYQALVPAPSGAGEP